MFPNKIPIKSEKESRIYVLTLKHTHWDKSHPITFFLAINASDLPCIFKGHGREWVGNAIFIPCFLFEYIYIYLLGLNNPAPIQMSLYFGMFNSYVIKHTKVIFIKE